MKVNFLVVIEKGFPAYSARVPDLPGCIAAGATVEDAINMLRSAIEFHLEGMITNGEMLPVRRTLSKYAAEIGELDDGIILTGIDAKMPRLETTVSIES